ncbi:MAG TPA: hypothetical protein DET40_12875 [Lentisphaeria bacterium]|nr:MAG: hypothetical protein A2X45_13800 [Lentisphaerae bacterium GWF2_50_93]HCE44434.1 hypothetical protein [Lentisphaeria bacterium]
MIVKNITLKEVARECGVTPQTASRILNGTQAHLHKKETVEQILKTAQILGYRPNVAAQSMRSGRHRCISLLTSPMPWLNILSGEFLVPIQENLSGLQYNLILNVLPEEESRAGKELPGIFRENFVDGILIGITHSIPEWLESIIRNLEVPKIWIGSKHETDCIHHDDFGAAYGITDRMVKGGHRKIAYQDLSTSEDCLRGCHFSVLDRMDGYLKAMKEAGLKPHVVRPEKYLPEECRTAYTMENLIEPFKPTAVVAYDIPYSGRPFLYSAWKKGLGIPEDVSFVSFTPKEQYENDLRISSFVPNSDLGKKAVRLLSDKIGNGNRPSRPVVLPFDFIEGDTLAGCTPAKKKRGGK